MYIYVLVFKNTSFISHEITAKCKEFVDREMCGKDEVLILLMKL
jgi:hypothetical protein